MCMFYPELRLPFLPDLKITVSTRFARRDNVKGLLLWLFALGMLCTSRPKQTMLGQLQGQLLDAAGLEQPLHMPPSEQSAQRICVGVE